VQDASAAFEGVDVSIQQTASERITEAVASWPGIEVDRGEIGEVAFKLGRREIGHVHGDHAAHFSFPKATWDDLRAQHRIEPHPVFPDKRGPASRWIRSDADVTDVIALFRVNYERLAAR
jgi:hypothetical protein